MLLLFEALPGHSKDSFSQFIFMLMSATEYEVQVKHLLKVIDSQRRLIVKLRADFELVQVIVGKVMSPVENELN